MTLIGRVIPETPSRRANTVPETNDVGILVRALLRSGALNRRLAPDVHLGIVPIVCDGRRFLLSDTSKSIVSQSGRITR
jgi:hypothetical protein